MTLVLVSHFFYLNKVQLIKITSISNCCCAVNRVDKGLKMVVFLLVWTLTIPSTKGKCNGFIFDTNVESNVKSNIVIHRISPSVRGKCIPTRLHNKDDSVVIFNSMVVLNFFIIDRIQSSLWPFSSCNKAKFRHFL